MFLSNRAPRLQLSRPRGWLTWEERERDKEVKRKNNQLKKAKAAAKKAKAQGNSDEAFEVSHIVSRRLIGSGEDPSIADSEREMLAAAEAAELPPEEFEYFIFWKGYKEEDCTWESYSCLDNCPDVLRAFLSKKAKERKQHQNAHQPEPQQQENHDAKGESKKQPQSSKQSRSSSSSTQQQRVKRPSSTSDVAEDAEEESLPESQSSDREDAGPPKKKQKLGSNRHSSTSASSLSQQLLATPSKPAATQTCSPSTRSSPSSAAAAAAAKAPATPESSEKKSAETPDSSSKRHKPRSPVRRSSTHSAVVPATSIPTAEGANSSSSSFSRKEGSEHKSYSRPSAKSKPQSPTSPLQNSSPARKSTASAAAPSPSSSSPNAHAPIFARHSKTPFTRKSHELKSLEANVTTTMEEDDDEFPATAMDVDDAGEAQSEAEQEAKLETEAVAQAKPRKARRWYKKATQADMLRRETAKLLSNGSDDLSLSSLNDPTASVGSASRPKRVAAATSQLMHQLDFEALDASRDELKELLMGRQLPVKYVYSRFNNRRRKSRAHESEEDVEDRATHTDMDSEAPISTAPEAVIPKSNAPRTKKVAAAAAEEDDEVGVSFIMSQKKNAQYLKPNSLVAIRYSPWLYKIKWDDGSETWEPESILDAVPEARRDWKRRQAIMEWRTSHPNEYEIGGQEEAAAMEEYEFISSYEQDPVSKKQKRSAGKEGETVVPRVLYVEEEGCEAEEEIDGTRARELLNMVTAADRERIEVEVLTREKFHKEIVNKEKRIQKEEETRVRQLVQKALNSPLASTPAAESTTEKPSTENENPTAGRD